MEQENVKWAFSKKRNDLGLEAIKQINHDVDGGATLTTIKALDKIDDANFHSSNDPVQEIQTKLTAFTKQNALPITGIILSSNNWTRMTKNTFARGQSAFGLAPERAPIGQMPKPFPGLAGVQAIVDISVPDDKFYCITKDALRLTEGPKMQISWPDHDKDTQNLKMNDFVGFASVDALLKGDKRAHIGGRVFSFALEIEATT